MELYARINILGGRAVRLPKGDPAQAIALDADPVSRARSWLSKGAHRLHVVDLDAGVYGDYQNRALIDSLIAEVDVPVQVAGGVRSAAEVDRLITAGAWRVAMGTSAIIDQVMTWEICRSHPGRVAISIDVLHDEELVMRGWMEGSGRYLEEALIELSSAGAAAFLISEARRDALSEPPNYEVLRRTLEYIDEPAIAAGGVRNLEDLKELMRLEAKGRHLAGVVVGREVTEGRFTMQEAAKLLRDV